MHLRSSGEARYERGCFITLVRLGGYGGVVHSKSARSSFKVPLARGGGDLPTPTVIGQPSRVRPSCASRGVAARAKGRSYAARLRLIGSCRVQAPRWVRVAARYRGDAPRAPSYLSPPRQPSADYGRPQRQSCHRSRPSAALGGAERQPRPRHTANGRLSGA
jgi:hypothetical protein